LSCGGILSDSVITNRLLLLTVIFFLKNAVSIKVYETNGDIFGPPHTINT